MPIFTNRLTLARKPDDVFAFLRDPKNRLQLTPPEWGLELVQGPPLLELGTRTTWRMRRFGMSQSLVMETTLLEPPIRLVEEQRQGPFRRWVHTLTCTGSADETLLHDVVDYEPPGGMLGLLLTKAQMETQLTQSFQWRDRQLRMIFEQR
jgi:ligand-binding SRPBCC domain-containing protein